MPLILPFYYLCQTFHLEIIELLSYFYHPDHLGSSSWITDNSGRPIQHLHYLPFGEDWVDQRNSSWNTPYTFSGKEKDVETGYGYFGARYYDSGLSIWLSVDPMSDKYPSMSPYNYCANNPVILVDPDGREFVNDEDKALVAQTHKNYDEKISQYRNELASTTDETRKTELNGYIKEMETAKTELQKLEESDQKYTFNFNFNEGADGKTTYDVNSKTVVIEIGVINTAVHELKHAFQFEIGQLSFLSNGLEGGELYEITDEYAAFERESAFRDDNSVSRADIQGSYHELRDKRIQKEINASNKSTMTKKLNKNNEIYRIPK